MTEENGHKEDWDDGTAWQLLKTTERLIEGKGVESLEEAYKATDEVREAFRESDLHRLRLAFFELVKLTK